LKLNKFVAQEHYQSPTPSEAVANIATEEAQYFTIMDAAKVTISVHWLRKAKN